MARSQPSGEDLAPDRLPKAPLNRETLGEALALAGYLRPYRTRFLTGLAEARAGRNEIARSTWRALLADAPRDAPWRELVEDRLRRLP